MSYFDKVQNEKPDLEKEISKMENKDDHTAEIALSDSTKKDYMYLEGVQNLIPKVQNDILERAANPSAIQDAHLAMAYIKGEPFMAIDNKYVPMEEGQIIIQREKVVMEYLKLKKLMKKYEDSKSSDTA